jgi:quinoprotein glucose dehydrogenase
MHFRSVAFAMLLSAAWITLPLRAAENEPAAGGSGGGDAQAAIKRFRPAPGLKVELLAAEPLLENVVSFDLDHRGRAYVVETHRRRSSTLDIRSFPFWLDADLSFRSVADRAEFYRRNVSDQNANFLRVIGSSPRLLKDFDQNGHIDWHDLEVETETIRLLTDSNGDGRYDTATDFATGFDTLVSGVAAGVLVDGTNVWFTCVPDLWKLSLPSADFTATVAFNASSPDPKTKITGAKAHSGFGVHIAFGGHDMHGLIKGPDGRIYWSIADRGTDWRPEFTSPFFPEAFLKQVLPDTGAIFRCEPDGSHIEVVAVGLRNPQELAFDDHGNLFTGDNNADGGDQARWVYVLPGSDSGWRIGWQWQNNPKLGAWNAEGMWWNAETNTAAWVLPHCGYAGRGPAGIAWYPGTGLPSRYDGHFILCDFPNGIRSFGLDPNGAGFRVVDDQVFLGNIFATDVAFGPDGGAYVLDWVEGWDKSGKGRIYRAFDETMVNDPLVKETKALLASGFSAKTPEELVMLLGHRDQRVRREAQWALVAKGETGLSAFKRNVGVGSNHPLLTRLHSIWGLAQLARQSGSVSRDARESLVPLLADPTAEIRAQAVRALGDIKATEAAPKLLAALQDSDARVRSLAAIALAQLQSSAAVPGLVAMLRDNADRDPWLRHSGMIGLIACASSEQLAALSKDDSEAVRVAAVDALRRHHGNGLTHFLGDASLRVRAESVRAIYDEQLTSLFPELVKHAVPAKASASSSRDAILEDAIALRLTNARFQLGKADDAAALAGLLQSASPAIRLEAAALFTAWTDPAPRDRVTGLHHPLIHRIAGDPSSAYAALASRIADDSEKPAVRTEALRALGALHAPALAASVAAAQHSTDAGLKKLANSITQSGSSASLADLVHELDSGSIPAQQSALAQLGKTSGSETVLAKSLDQFAAGTLRPELALDLKEAIAAKGSSALKTRLAQIDAQPDAADPLAAYRDTLVGGDAINGRKIFTENQALACQRCHSIQKGDGGEVGPLLGGIGSRQTRDYLLESIVRPNAKIAAGFENVILTLKNGREVAGLVKQETSDTLQVLSPEDGLVTVKTADLKIREHAPSSMLEGLAEQMSRRDLRDLVEFLASLK